VVPPYYQHPAYIEAMTRVITEELAKLPWQPDHHVLSFHGIPKRYSKAGDPYATHVKRTTRALTQQLGWPRRLWTQTFQSLFGREVWLKPYTDDVLKTLARQGRRRSSSRCRASRLIAWRRSMRSVTSRSKFFGKRAARSCAGVHV